MKLVSIKYTDSGISLYCGVSEEEERERLIPERIHFAIISYEISVIDDPDKKVRETCKINRKNIEFISHNFTLFFTLEELVKPMECQITLRSLLFKLDDGKKVFYRVEKSYCLSELYSSKEGTEQKIRSHGHAKTQGMEGQSLQKGKINKTGEKKIIHAFESSSQLSPVKNDLQHLFEDSYQKFKDLLNEPNLQKYLKAKQNTIDFELKNFGMSLLCKLLLLVKYMNTLVDNDFQSDLHKFLQYSMFETKIAEEGV
ncbi:MAG: hypothetical protein ACFFCI_10930 [Promethearchaeota archaeon]